MRVLVSGSSGLVGSALIPVLEKDGHSVVRLVRRPPGKNEILWDPENGAIDAAALEGFDAVVHLAGESIATRWTPAAKARILASRSQGTSTLANALARRSRQPRVLVSASAVGYYGDRGDEVLREDSPSGSDFTSEVGRRWEAATAPAADAGIQVARLRIGIVLSTQGGALARMLPPFRMALGGRLGSGRQWMSWIALEDLVGVIRHAIEADALTGPVNTVAPNPVTNAEFTRALAAALHRPAIFPMPAFMVRLIFGEMGESLLLGSQRVDSGKLLASGYRFQHPELKAALQAVLS